MANLLGCVHVGTDDAHGSHIQRACQIGIGSDRHPNQGYDLLGPGHCEYIRQGSVVEKTVLRIHDQVIPAVDGIDLGDLGRTKTGYHTADANLPGLESLFDAVFFEIHPISSSRNFWYCQNLTTENPASVPSVVPYVLSFFIITNFHIHPENRFPNV